MPKIGPNKVSIDPKAYAARITRAKKIVAMTDPATKAKINEMYPAVKKEAIAKNALEPKKTKEQVAAARKKRMNAEMNAFGKTRTSSKGVKTPMPKTGPSGKKTPMPKVEGAKPGVKTPMSKTTTKAPAKTTPMPKVTKKPEKMTPQDAAMKKILEKKYGKIYG